MQKLFLKDYQIQIKGIVISLLCFLFCWVTFYPGYMSYDSFQQYLIGKSLVFNDWHPPIMSWVWSILNFFFKGPSGMLAMNLFLLWLSLFLLWNVYRAKKYSFLFLLLGLSPQVINLSGVLWKDVGLAFSLILVFAIGLYRRSSFNIAIIILLLFYSLNLRYNSIFAVIPILFFIIKCWLPYFSNIKTIFLSLLLSGLILYIGQYFNYEILKSERVSPVNFIMIDDLANLSIKYDKSLIPNIDIQDIKRCSSYEIGFTKEFGRAYCIIPGFPPPYSGVIRAGSPLTNVWIAAILDHPLDYLKFRFSAFSYFIRSPLAPPYAYWFPEIMTNNEGFKTERNGLTIVFEKYIQYFADVTPWLFKPYWWIYISITALLLTMMCEVNKQIFAAQSLLVSSLIYIFGYFPVVGLADFRYIYWSTLASSVAILLMLVDGHFKYTSLGKLLFLLFCSVTSILVFTYFYVLF